MLTAASKSSRRLHHGTAVAAPLGGGILGALLAAVPGLLDSIGLHGARERRVATTHLMLNLGIVAIQAINFWLRSQPEYGGSRLPVWISIAAVAALLVSGWLGGQLVHVLGVTQPHRYRSP
jgi:uncharacterized membrane protein